MTTRKKKAKRPAEKPVCAVQVALEVAHARADRMGRPLHPVEVRWVVRHEFRTRYASLNSVEADSYADHTIDVISAMVS